MAKLFLPMDRAGRVFAALAGLVLLVWVGRVAAKPLQEMAQGQAFAPSPAPAVPPTRPRVAQWEYRQLVRCLSAATFGHDSGEWQMLLFPELDAEGRRGWELVSMMGIQDPRQAQEDADLDPRAPRLTRSPRQCLLAVLKRQSAY